MGDSARVLVVDDHALIAHGLAVALAAEGVEARVTAGPTVDAVLDEAQAFRPDVTLLDLQLEGEIGSGVPLIEPLLALGTEVLVVTGVRDRVAWGECLEAGATGVAGKHEPFDRLVERVLRIAAGDRSTHPEAGQLLVELRAHRARCREQLAPFDRLSRREAEVLGLLLDGVQAEAIARECFVSIATVRSQIRSILQKLGVRSQLAAVAMARDAGWTPGTPVSSPAA